MILRAITNAEQHVPFNRWDLDLECGHRLEWILVKRPFPKRKRCEYCEGIKEFATDHPGDYSTLLDLSHMIPLEDRPQAMVEWVSHICRAIELYRKIPGLDTGIAMRLADRGGSYPLPLSEDDCGNSSS